MSLQDTIQRIHKRYIENVGYRETSSKEVKFLTSITNKEEFTPLEIHNFFYTLYSFQNQFRTILKTSKLTHKERTVAKSLIRKGGKELPKVLLFVVEFFDFLGIYGDLDLVLVNAKWVNIMKQYYRYNRKFDWK